MKITNLTWLGFFLVVSSLSITPKTLAVTTDVKSSDLTENIENRLNRIHDALKSREKNLPEESELENLLENEILLGGFFNGGGGWANGRGGSFLNRNGPGGFLNNRGGSGFLNRPGGFYNNRGWGDRGWGDGGGFWNRR